MNVGRVYDCFCFFNEYELLKLRLDLLWNYVDEFIICESNVTHSGHTKPWNFENFLTQYPEYKKKITYLKFSIDPTTMGDEFYPISEFTISHPAWKLENRQRDFLVSALSSKEIADEDLIFVTDCDEIWSPDMLRAIYELDAPFSFARIKMSLHYYYLNCIGVGRLNDRWMLPFLIRGAHLRELMIDAKLSFSALRGEKKDGPKFNNGGWHFSYLGDIEAIIVKIKAFAHQEFNTAEFLDREGLERRIRLGLDPFNRKGHKFAFIPIETFELSIRPLIRERSHLCKIDLV